ncbi:hypothetical protein AMTRI_Chr13g82760 [Amborella trichopoda]|uniref:AT-hook motif nuclear-localized protein n=1 Tax=Amborella trichopoda TaxID=13333 RepID=W1PNL4_AMBTC|nr:AT-hook motif nuclear-localized protein 10 [Amborella trichopoda]ERN09306.1 hypothetical protein AMTR_s00149p00085280 [Amborella trichopoda]|eukprot:XP_006847725.1 AT-hook motif nuclear-localized protein 10 [Amborella trichopoda]
MEGREPPNMMMGTETYGSSMQNSPMVATPQGGLVQNMRLPFNTVVSKQTEANAPLNYPNPSGAIVPHGASMSEPIKKKRGRPRKYGPDGSVSLALASPISSVPGYSTTPSYKRNRGRPAGAGGRKQQMAALGTAGVGFTPHIIAIMAGEDVASKIMSFSQQGPRAICILSANGAISNVTLRQAATSGGTVTYEGRFEIISLSGSYLLTERDGILSRTGGLSVSLAGPDGRVLGGGVAGLLVAATPVQVVVGSFIAEGKKPKPKPQIRDPLSASAFEPNQSSSPHSHGSGMSGDESSGGGASPVSTHQLHQSQPTVANNGHSVQNMPSSYSAVNWPSSQSARGTNPT